jgi:hypothetical protein
MSFDLESEFLRAKAEAEAGMPTQQRYENAASSLAGLSQNIAAEIVRTLKSYGGLRDVPESYVDAIQADDAGHPCTTVTVTAGTPSMTVIVVAKPAIELGFGAERPAARTDEFNTLLLEVKMRSHESRRSTTFRYPAHLQSSELQFSVNGERLFAEIKKHLTEIV